MALLLSACHVDAVVVLDADQTGTGTVTVTVELDDDATAALADVGEEVALDDVRAAGWEVRGPEPDGDGSRITAVKHFESPAEAERILEEVAGPALEDVSFEVERGFARTRTSLDAVVELTRGIETFGDPRLTEQLGGLPLGMPGSILDEQLGAPSEEVFDLTFVARLAGGEGATVEPEFGERTAVDIAATDWHTLRLLAAAVALAAALAAVVLAARRHIPHVEEQAEAQAEAQPDDPR